MTQVPGSATARMRAALVAWGVWPACIMVLGQMEAARFLGMRYNLRLAALTAAGTMAVYGADRVLERLVLARTEDRHAAGRRDLVFPCLIALLALFALPAVPEHVGWLLRLAVGGSLYLAVTVGILKPPLLFKELLGAVLFTTVVWGWMGSVVLPIQAAFALMGLANFLYAAHADRVRDAANGLRGIAVRFPEAAVWTARLTAGFACGFFVAAGQGGSLFAVTAFLHCFWLLPSAQIDRAFIPLLALPMLLIVL